MQIHWCEVHEFQANLLTPDGQRLCGYGNHTEDDPCRVVEMLLSPVLL